MPVLMVLPPSHSLPRIAHWRKIPKPARYEFCDSGCSCIAQKKLVAGTRRSRVVGRLLFLQVALLLMGAPLTVWPSFQPTALAVAGIGLILFLFAWIRNISGAADQ